jgi:hypothetical protein
MRFCAVIFWVTPITTVVTSVSLKAQVVSVVVTGGNIIVVSHGEEAPLPILFAAAAVSLVVTDAAIYDLSKRSQEEVRFGMDLSFNMRVGLQAIEASNTLVGEVSLLPKGVSVWIDSTVPEIWLPGAACDLFANAFGKRL